MAPQKRKAETYDKSDPFIADDDESSSAPAPKRTKNTPSTSGSHTTSEMKRDEEGNNYWEISKARRVTISEFKGKRMISIREYYEKDGKWLPGKKGITMTVEQYSTFLTLVPQIEAQLVEHGETIPRPQYNAGPVGRGDDGFLEDGSADDSKKANIEATSDEDEGD